jgi:hypothetical protein
MPHDPFTQNEIDEAWFRSGGFCECCRKRLFVNNQGRGSGTGAWEAHCVEGPDYPLILCTGEPQNCHLNCGHDGDYQNPGVLPQFHLGG